MDFFLLTKICLVAKMENSEDKLQHVAGGKDELYKDFAVGNKGKEVIQDQIQGKEFQPIEFPDLMSPPYEEDSSNDEEFTIDLLLM